MENKETHQNLSIVNKIKVAFLGGGCTSAAGRLHRTAIEMDNRFELIAGCFSRNATLNLESALEYGISAQRVYCTLESLIQAELGNIDAIIILTPTDQHKSQVIQCLEAGIPVICEKALTTSIDDVMAIQMKLKNGGYLAVTYNYTGYPMIRELKRIISRGDLGKLQQIHVEMPQEGFLRVNQVGTPILPQEWRLNDGKIPTISLDLGVHLHMLVYFLTGENPISVAAASNSFGNFDKIIDDVSCLAHYTNNIMCNFWFSKTALGQRNGMKVRIYGKMGSAEWTQENPENISMADNQGRRFIIDRGSRDIEISNQKRYTRFKAGHPAGFIEAFANYYEDVAESVHAYINNQFNYENPYVFGIKESLEGMRLFDAMAESASTQKWIQL